MNCLMHAWHRHEGELRGWLRRRLGDPVDAEDALLVQRYERLRGQGVYRAAN